MNLTKTPATVVTGFLGSGKTTLLSNIIKQAGNKRIAIIVNEFGEMDIDSDLLRSCAIEGCEDNEVTLLEDGVYELANGCICCTVEEEFLPVMKKLVERRDEIDHILIETSGLALPKPLVQAFNWPEVQNHFTVDAVITVVDGPALAEGRFAHSHEQLASQRQADTSLDHDPSIQELYEDQLGAADLVIISKTDLINAEQLEYIEADINTHTDDSIKVISIERGEINPELILGLEAASEDHIEALHSHHDHHHEHGKHHHHAHDDFDSAVISMGRVDGDQLLQQLERVIEAQNIYRAKGFVALADKPMRQVVQAVGSRIDQYFDRLWQVDETPRTEVVLIGKALDIQQIEVALKSAEIV
ncbi:MAG TPA: cobalamin biosynthesis protein CobW [Leucothrix mucor]|uniref:Cobalamin biosynthesis protein CobW n=1 Tax=Leucothrix mucor TaxID=45248 RepID=A0A7V2T1Q6_LEUMU|nr:cobalamin biosynthesis protein CobW [Leucothrix mucor]